MSRCDECTVGKYCDDFGCLSDITCDETRDMIGQIRADAIEEYLTYVRDHAEDSNDGWSMADLILLSADFLEEQK